MKIKLLFLIIFSLVLSNKSNASGEIAFISFQSDDPDQFSFVTTVDFPGNYQLVFTDNGWNGTSFNTTEGNITWTTPGSGVPAGTIVTLTTSTANIGSVSSTGSFALSTSGDQIIAYFIQNITNNQIPIAAVNFSGAWITTGTITSNTTYLPPGLTNGGNAVALSNQDNGNYNCTGGTTNGDKSFIQGEINNSSNWTVSASIITPSPVSCTYTVNGAALPVTLLSFNGYYNINSVHITWQTDSESNFSHFEVMRSFDAKGFESIGRVEGKGAEATEVKYSFIDENPKAGNNYYKLKQVDKDGKTEFSKIISVNNTNTTDIIVYPNPAFDYVSFKNINKEEISTIQIRNKAGKLLKEMSCYDLSLKISDIQDTHLIIEIILKSGLSISKNIVKL